MVACVFRQEYKEDTYSIWLKYRVDIIAYEDGKSKDRGLFLN